MDAGATSLNIALIHHPVLNKRNEVIGSAITNLDIHDIARTSRTYGVSRYYLTTPYTDQQTLVQELLDHWQTGHGAVYNPARKKALEIVRIADSLDEVVDDLSNRYDRRPLVIATSAQRRSNTVEYEQVKTKLRDQEPVLLLFGTAHGLAPEVLTKVDGMLPPIQAKTNYNHLSVRSAASIIIDRLLGF